MTQRITNCRLFDGEQVFADRDIVLAGGVIAEIVATGGRRRARVVSCMISVATCLPQGLSTCR